MAQPILTIKESNEVKSWECFEVGAYDKVIELSEKEPTNPILNHLAIMAHFERGDGNSINYFEKMNSSITVFSHLIHSYTSYFLNNKKEASESILNYFKTNQRPLCFSIISFGVKATYEAKMYNECLLIISLEKLNQNSFILQKFDCFYYVKKYAELVNLFKANFKLLGNDLDIYTKVGLCLHSLGKYQEAERILQSFPSKKKLPSFEEKKVLFQTIIDKLPDFETAKEKVNDPMELKDIGFAYLFNKEYKKAEEIFKKAISSSEFTMAGAAK